MNYKTLKNWARFLKNYLWHRCAKTVQQLLSQNEKENTLSNCFQTQLFVHILHNWIKLVFLRPSLNSFRSSFQNYEDM